MFHSSNEETRNFRPNWTEILNASYKVVTDLEMAFINQRNKGGLYIEGFHGNYPPRSYVATIGKYRRKIDENLNFLKTNNWIDRLTKAVIVDIVTYNANTNLFSRVRIVIEQPSIGNLIVHGNIRSFILYTYLGDTGTVILMMQLVWLVVMFYMTVKMIKGILKQKKSYFTSNYWSILRLFGLAFAVLAAITSLVKIILAMEFIEKVKNELGECFQIKFQVTLVNIISSETKFTKDCNSLCFMSSHIFSNVAQLAF